MLLDDFIQTPWKKQHPVYRGSLFSITPAPEYANSEVLVASLYRTIGFQGISEGTVPSAGREFDKKIQKLRKKGNPPSGSIISADLWNTILHWILESPKLPNQSSKRFLQISPLVPNTALFSGSARLAGNPWPAGTLVQRMVWMGSNSDVEALQLWRALFEALSVCDDDDVFAQFLEAELAKWLEKSEQWTFVEPQEDSRQLFSAAYYGSSMFPAKQFVKDLSAIIRAKSLMTRRQWISLLDAIIRLASVSHVMWLCKMQGVIWKSLKQVLRDENFTKSPLTQSRFQYITYENKAISNIKECVSGYLEARLGINFILWALEDSENGYRGSLSSNSDILSLCDHVAKNKDILFALKIHEAIDELFDQESRTLRCRKGIGSNLMEFSRYVLGQRQTADPILRGYDQGYVLKKRSIHPSSPWIVSLGPAAVLALVHCALYEFDTPRSIHRLSQHLYYYGIANDRNDISHNELGHQLRMLGLILDSPDAESGMLILPPFPAKAN